MSQDPLHDVCINIPTLLKKKKKENTTKQNIKTKKLSKHVKNKDVFQILNVLCTIKFVIIKLKEYGTTTNLTEKK